MTVEPDTQGS